MRELERCTSIEWALEHYRTQIPKSGAFAEFGVYGGHNVVVMAATGRRVYAFDTFEGLPHQDYIAKLDTQNPPGQFKAAYDVPVELAKYPNVIVRKGRFADTLKEPLEPLAFVHIDCDYYLSHQQVLAAIKLVPGAVLLFDDYTALEGSRRAVDEWRGDLPINERVVIIPGGEALADEPQKLVDKQWVLPWHHRKRNV